MPFYKILTSCSFYIKKPWIFDKQIFSHLNSFLFTHSDLLEGNILCYNLLSLSPLTLIDDENRCKVDVEIEFIVDKER